MTNFNTSRLGQLVTIAIALAALSACGKSEFSPTVANPTPSAIAASPSPSPVASVPPVAAPVTIAVESSSKPAAPAASATPAATTDPSPANIPQTGGNCKGAEKTLLVLESKNYVVKICGVTTPEFYVGSEKENPSVFIRLPLKEASPTFFMALNGDTTYIVAQTARGNFLTVTQGSKELVREVVTGW